MNTNIRLSSDVRQGTRMKQIFNNLKRDKYLYIMIIPFVAFYIIFQYMPFYGLQIAFKDYNIFKGIGNSPWVGLDNFVKFFTGPFFVRTFKNTLVISLYNIAVGFPAPILLALLLNEIGGMRYRKMVQTVVCVPHFISIVVVAGLVTNLLSPGYGLVNNLVDLFGGERVYFLAEAKWFRGIYTFMNTWKETGFNSIIYTAALSGINLSLYEAAEMDGAGRLKKLIHVTIPGILPTIIIMFILRIGRLLDVGYESIILLYQPNTYETADVISTYVYRAGLEQAQYSLASAVGIFNGIVGLLLVWGSNAFSKKISGTSLW